MNLEYVFDTSWVSDMMGSNGMWKVVFLFGLNNYDVISILKGFRFDMRLVDMYCLVSDMKHVNTWLA